MRKIRLNSCELVVQSQVTDPSQIYNSSSNQSSLRMTDESNFGNRSEVVKSSNKSLERERTMAAIDPV